MPDAALPLTIMPYQPADQPYIRAILTRIGWQERYIAGVERSAADLALRDDAAVYAAHREGIIVGMIIVELHAWNGLAQIQWRAVEPPMQRQGVATMLVAAAERFAQAHSMRGIYLDTPIDNERGRRFYEAVGFRVGYIMPRYYADAQDGVTYQKFWDHQPRV